MPRPRQFLTALKTRFHRRPWFRLSLIILDKLANAERLQPHRGQDLDPHLHDILHNCTKGTLGVVIKFNYDLISAEVEWPQSKRPA
jgi:hypothetical protein